MIELPLFLMSLEISSAGDAIVDVTNDYGSSLACTFSIEISPSEVARSDIDFFGERIAIFCLLGLLISFLGVYFLFSKQ